MSTQFSKRGYEEEHLFSFRNPEAHNQRRKLLSRGYSQSTLLGIEQEIAAKIQTLLDTCAREATDTKPVDIYGWVHLLSFDIVYRLLFGEDPKSLEPGGEHKVLSYFRAWRPIFIYVERILATTGAVWHILARESWEQLSQSQGMERAWAVLSRSHQEVPQECRRYTILPLGSLRRRGRLPRPTSHRLRNCRGMHERHTCSRLPYLQAMINETLRMYPTIVAMLPRIATRHSIVTGVPVPKGTVVGIQNYTVHRREPAFPYPEDIDPDRWLDDENMEQRKEAFLPFSVGARRCIGMK
ncbi:cytochrome P450 [Dactylonectria macrodidyma]|uniref:Cytochrome P450 n=1 Tax=Dactylonectria macrodidyma TaxID=307937 RepID=A0A9P9FMX1_9HYPO|nr:cytochrome P450 [Dactylonectria macrodidyma]